MYLIIWDILNLKKMMMVLIKLISLLKKEEIKALEEIVLMLY